MSQKSKEFSGKPIEVLYEDDHYIIFDKPSGLLVIPSPKREKNTLTQIVNREYAANFDRRLFPCHRLDRETSGAIIFAKGKRNQKLMMEAFRQRTVKKTYIAFVHGRVAQGKGDIQGKIRSLDSLKYNRKSRFKFAHSKYRVVKQGKRYSVVEVYPITGRTNQIRIQFSSLGHPLVGERKYAFARDYQLKFKRTALHASSLQWVHPATHKNIRVDSKLPKDMEVFIARTRN